MQAGGSYGICRVINGCQCPPGAVLRVAHGKVCHSVPFPLDVAYLDVDGTVIKVQRLARWRVAQPVPRARAVVEARAGSFERWGVAPGGRLEVRTP